MKNEFMRKRRKKIEIQFIGSLQEKQLICFKQFGKLVKKNDLYILIFCERAH